MAAEVWETPFPQRVGEAAAGKITAEAQQAHRALAAPQVHAIGGGGTATERRARIIQLAEEALGRAGKDLAIAKSALGAASVQDAKLRAREACDGAELCCDRLLLVDLLLDLPPRVPVVGADDDFTEDKGVRLRAADALEKAMRLAEDCASLVRRACQDAFGTPAT